MSSGALIALRDYLFLFLLSEFLYQIEIVSPMTLILTLTSQISESYLK